MTSRIPEPASPYEEEGLGAGGDTLPEKEITGDAQDGMALPADQPWLSDDYGTTAREQWAGEPVSVRVEREEPDVLSRVDDPADYSATADTPFPAEADERVGRLVDPDEGGRADTEADSVGYDVGTDTGGFSAEERAMRIEREP